MDARTKENSIKVLNNLRDVYQSQLDTRVIGEIEAVIAALENDCDCSESSATSEDWGLRVLKVIGEVVRIVTNISDLMN